MFAIAIDDGALVWREVPTPVAAAHQVVIRAVATAVNRADLLQRRGRYPVPPGASPILGLEVSGVVESLGADVEHWKVGDRVCALLEGGGYAERVVVDASMLLPAPKNLSLVETAALPEVFYTAWLNVFMETNIQAGETVLVHAAASGVGTAAIQLCAAHGHRSFATASGPKLAAVAALGADVLIDRNTQSFAQEIAALTNKHGVDVILDPVGAAYLDDNIRSLATGGRLVVIGLLGGIKGELALGRLMSKRARVIGSVLRSRSRAEKVQITASLRENVWPLFDTGALRPVIHSVLPIQQSDEAHGLLETNATTGKVVLQISEQ